MTEVATMARTKRIKQHKQVLAEQAELRAGLQKTHTLISQAYANFNSVSDPDLIESYVFEINALQARYAYLLRRVKELEP